MGPLIVAIIALIISCIGFIYVTIETTEQGKYKWLDNMRDYISYHWKKH